MGSIIKQNWEATPCFSMSRLTFRPCQAPCYTSIFQGKIHLFDANCKDLAARNMLIDVSETGGLDSPIKHDKAMGGWKKPIGSSTASIFIGETRFICLMITMETHENPWKPMSFWFTHVYPFFFPPYLRLLGWGVRAGNSRKIIWTAEGAVGVFIIPIWHGEPVGAT